MSSYPPLEDLLWLFEAEPQIQFDDLGWPQSAASWETVRGDWRLLVTLDVYSQDLQVTAWRDAAEIVDLQFWRIVEHVAVDRTHGSEALVAAFVDSASMKPLRLNLKPTISLRVESRLPWERI